MTVPVLPGKGDLEIKKATGMFATSPDSYRESRRQVGITLKRAYLRTTPMDAFVIAYLESDQGIGDTRGRLATSGPELDRQFVAFVKATHGVEF